MLISHQERPRELKWYHAGPLLYGDLGTSRFYVLGLAFYFALFSSFWYILSVGLLVVAVGWAYTVVCRAYPDGGGVYSAARQISPMLSVVGALLLFADYAVTAALSAFEGMHYFGLESARSVQFGACIAILILGLVNYIGPKRAGTFALLVALATLLLTVILVGFSVPHLSAGIAAMKPMHGPVGERWSTFVAVVLALSGVEAVANMTGIMVKPVDKTAKKSIWPVLAEVVIFNLILGVAMLALPAVLAKAPGHRTDEFKQPAANFSKPAPNFARGGDEIIKEYRTAHPDYGTPGGKAAYEAFESNLKEPHSSPSEEDVKNKVLRVMAEQFVHPWFGAIAGVVFGLLLISAVNTVIGGMISVAYVMSRDQELPRFFGKLNLFGVPWVGLIPALIVPCILLMMFTNLEQLADLYAIGVVGAIAINLSCCTVNGKLPIKTWERLGIGLLAAIMVGIELTLAAEKLHALVFVGIILVVGLGMRFFTKAYLPARARMKRPPTPEELTTGRYRGVEVHIEGAVAPLEPAPVSLASFATPATQLDMSKPTILVATRGGKRLIDFASNYVKQIGGNLFVIYVRQFNVQFGPERMPKFEEDKQAQETFAAAFEACKKAGIAMVPIYVASPDVADSILDFAATYNVSALLMGVSRTGAVLRALRGDVLTAVADNLPQDIPLLIHA